MSARLRRRLAPALFPCLAVLACAAPPPDGPAVPASGLHRVEARGDAADALVRAGATVVADYGTFRLLDASPAALRAAGAAADVEVRNDYLKIALNSGELDTSIPDRSATALRAATAGGAGKALHLLQFAGPIRPEWLERLQATGVRVVSSVPWNAYLLYGDAPALDRVQKLAAGREVQHSAPYLAAHKIDRALAGAALEGGAYAVQLVEDAAANEETLAVARSLAARPPKVSAELGYVNVVVHGDRALVDALAARPDVVSVQPWAEPRKNDERQDMILAGRLSGAGPSGPGYLAWLAAKGFTQAQFDASGFGVDVTDSGIDDGTTSPNHFGLWRQGAVGGASRVSYVRLMGTPHSTTTTQGCDGHGTLNAHVVAGWDDASGFPFQDPGGYHYGLGVAPFVRVGGSVIFDPDSFTSPDYEDLISRAYADGMRISTNSWGASSSSYGFDCQRYDALVRDAAPVGSAVPLAGNQPMVIVFAAGNDGPGTGTIGSPGNAKNVLAAGASENVHPFGGADRCLTGDDEANAALDVASFSSRGPTADGRVRPDLLAPGTHVTGGVAQADGQAVQPPGSPNGQSLACFVASGVCGGVSSNYFPAGQQWYTASTGTSHSTPAIAGAAALLRQWFVNEGLPPPSPAMTKAFLMNSARYMTGAGANDALYSNAQGMGLLDLGAAFDGTARLLRDQEAEDLFTATGQARTFTSAVGDPSKPFRVTLAWTDAPGPTFASAWVNDLDLRVDVGGASYRGNVFSGATSVTGGAADARNNVESVFLPAGTTGPFTVTVTAANLSGDGVPGNATPLDQDFALVVWNGCADPRPGAPSGVTATPTADNQITVSWTPSGAGAYLVYRGTAAGGPYDQVGTVTAPPFVDGGRSGGATYRYVVRAQQGCAVSVASAEAVATATGPCLVAPVFAGLATADTTGDAICGNALAWSPATASCGGTIRYDVFRATAGDFAPGPATRIAQGVAGTSFVDTGGLQGGTDYFYVVRAVETTPGAVLDDGNTVRRAASPYLRTPVALDDFDASRPPSPGAWWIERSTYGAELLNLVSGCRWQSAQTAYRFGQASSACGGSYGDSVSNDLVLGGDGTVSPSVNGLALPAVSGIALTFRISYDFESCCDGAYLAWSTAGAGGPFTRVQDVPGTGVPYIVTGGYDGSPYATGGRAWTGTAPATNGAFKEVVVNLDALAGQTVWFAFRFGTDGSVVREGFYLDDVRIEAHAACESCALPPPPVPGGVAAAATADNRVTVTWSPSAGADGYEVERATGEGPFSLVASVAAPPFVDATVSGGLAYRYAVRARAACARSAPSQVAPVVATGACLLPPAFGGLASASTTGEITCGNRLAWTAATSACGGALTYDVYRSTSAGFVPDPASRIATGLAGTSFVDSGDLAGGTTYHYVVRAVETTAAGSVSDGNAVERSAAPSFVALAFRDDFDAVRPEEPGSWWTERAILGADQLELVQGCHYQSASTAYRFGQPGGACGGAYADATQNLLVLGGDGSAGANGLEIPAGGGATLAFRLWYDFESSYDGARLEWSTTGASGSFTPVPDSLTAGSPYIVTGRYDGYASALGRAWTGVAAGANGALKQVVVNLDALAGQTVWFGWRMSTDGSVRREGLYLDDVALDGSSASCSTTPLPPGAPVRYRVALPSTVTADAPVTATITAVDPYGQVSTGYAGRAALSTDDPAAVLPADATFTAGIASATLRFRTAGRRILTAQDAANAALSGRAGTTVVGGPPVAMSFVGIPLTATAGLAIPGVGVGVTDAFGNPATATVTIALGANPGGDVLSGTLTATAAGGVAAFPDLHLARAASGYTLVATAGALSATSAPFAVVAGPPAALAFVSEPPAAIAGEPLSPRPAVEVRDAYGNRAYWYGSVSLLLAWSPAGATLGGTTTAPLLDGAAEFTDVFVDRAGDGYQLLATTGGLASALGTPFSASAAPARRAVFVQEPGNVAAGVAFSPPVTAALYDRFDNPALAPIAVTLTLASNPSLGTLLGPTTVTSSGGGVTFPGVAIDRAGPAYALYVGASGLEGDTSVGFDVYAGAVTRYRISGPTTPPLGTEVTYVAEAQDALGNAVAGYAGMATVTTTDPAAALPAPVPFSAGRTGPFPVTFRTGGAQTLTVAETPGSASGTASVNVGGAPAPAVGNGGGGGGCGCGSGSAGGAGLLFALAALSRRRARS